MRSMALCRNQVILSPAKLITVNTLCQEAKATLPGASTNVSVLVCDATNSYTLVWKSLSDSLFGPGSSIPQCKPQGPPPGMGTSSRKRGGPSLPSGPTYPCSTAVHTEPFPTSVFKILSRIFATSNKIHTRGCSISAYAMDCTATEYRVNMGTSKPSYYPVSGN